MRKRLIVAAIVFGIASLAGLSIGIESPLTADSAVIDGNARVVLHGNVSPKARPEFDVGPTDPSLPMDRMILLLKIAPEKQAQLNRLLAEQQDPSSPNFRRWLTPEEFGEKFGRSPDEIATVSGWLVKHGFTIEETAKGGTWINFSGTSANVESAFQVKMHDYSVNGHMYHANSNDPSIPPEIAGLVAGPVVLHNFPHRATHTRLRPMPEGKLQPNYTETDGSHDLAPGDFAAIYDVNGAYSLGYDGEGVTIAIVGRTHPNSNKWNTFRSTFGLPGNPPRVIVNGPDPGDLGGDEDVEADLDVEWSGAVAKGATIDFVVSASTYSADGVDLSAQYIVDHNLAPIMSSCFDTCEPDLGSTWSTFYFDLWEQAASQGITVFVASGDSGAYDCIDYYGNPISPRAVNGLASTPHNIAVGGTSLNNLSDYWSSANGADGVSASGYIPEVAWNNWDQGYYWASGGGASSFYSKPAWQVSPGVPNDGRRDMPDVSLNADPFVGYRVFTCTYQNGPCTSLSSNSWQIIGGTSAASPSFAGIMALIVQSTGGQRQGNANSVMYQLGNAQYGGASGASTVFNDIISGDNGFSADLTGYSCTVGYDLVTGLGSVDTTNLLLAFQELEVLVVKTFNIADTGNTPGSTSSRTVTLDNTATGGKPSYYMASESSTFSKATWKPYSTAPSFTLSAGNGTKTVYFRVRNAKSVSAKVSGTIVLAQPPTVNSFKIDGGAKSAIDPTVTLNNTATISPTQFTASESPDFTGAVVQGAYSTAPEFTLTSVSGTHTVYFEVENNVGPSTPVSATIQLILPPTVTLNIPASTSSRTITLNNTATNSPTYYAASQSPSFRTALWKPYSPAPHFTLSAGTGLKTVYFKVKNAAGDSTVASANITFE
jgi:subtilase family serine protease